MIRFDCPVCGEEISASEEHAGKTGKCKACGKPVQIPPVVLKRGASNAGQPDVPGAVDQPAQPAGWSGMTNVALLAVISFSVLGWYAILAWERANEKALERADRAVQQLGR